MTQTTDPVEDHSKTGDSENDLPPTLEETKEYFQKFISKLIKTAQNYDPKLYKPKSEETSESISEEELVSDKILIKRNSYLHDNLKRKLINIKKKFSVTVLEDFFVIFIDELIQMNRKEKVDLSSLKRIFDVFASFEMKKIPKNAIEKLIAALQWGYLPVIWLYSQNFLSDYFNNILPSDVPQELRKQTWVLLELTRIKIEEEQRKKEIINEFI